MRCRDVEDNSFTVSMDCPFLFLEVNTPLIRIAHAALRLGNGTLCHETAPLPDPNAGSQTGLSPAQSEEEWQHFLDPSLLSRPGRSLAQLSRYPLVWA